MHTNEKQTKTAIPLEPIQICMLFLVAVLCMVPGFLFSRLHITDGFLYQIISYVQLTLPLDHLETFVQGGYSFQFVEFLPGYPMILSLFSRLGAISPEQLHFMPIAGIFVPLCYFTLSQKLYKSFTLSILLALYSAYDIGLASHYNVFAYTWSNLIYLGFLLMSLRVMEQKKISDSIILFILFAGSLFLHYASTMWLIVFMLSLNLLFYLKGLRGKQVTRKAASLAMPFAFTIAFLAFNQIFYRVWLPSFQEAAEESTNALELFSAKILTYLGQRTSTPEEYQFLNPWGEDFGWWRTAEYLLILIPIGLWFLRMSIDWIRQHPVSIKRPYYLELTITAIVTALIDWFVYGAHSGINMRYISLVFPFLTAIALDQLLTRKWLRNTIVGALTVTAIVTYVLAFQHHLEFPPTSYGQAQVSSDWFLSHQIKDTSLSDLDTSGLFLATGSKSDNPLPNFIVYDSDIYASLANAENTEAPKSNYGFVIIDSGQLAKPLHGVSNRLYQPLSFHIDTITANPYLNKVYDDGSIWILRRSPGSVE